MIKASHALFDPLPLEVQSDRLRAGEAPRRGRASERSSASVTHEDAFSLAAALQEGRRSPTAPSSEVDGPSLDGEDYRDQEVYFREVCRGFCIRDW